MNKYIRQSYKRIYIYQSNGMYKLYAGTDKNGIIYEDNTHIAKQYKEGMANKIANDLVHKYGVKVLVDN